MVAIDPHGGAESIGLVLSHRTPRTHPTDSGLLGSWALANNKEDAMKLRTKARSCKLVLFLLLFSVYSLAESPYCKLCLSKERQLLAEYERNRHKASVSAEISKEIELLRKQRFAHRKGQPESCRSRQSEPDSVLFSSTLSSPRPLANAVKEDRKHTTAGSR